jgi:transcriptional regulator with XRE-family HTH domain
MNKSLIFAREIKKWSIAKLVSELGEPDYGKYESGELLVTNELADKLGHLYEVAPDYFLETDIPMINFNEGINSHSNKVVYPEHYIDINNSTTKDQESEK